MASEECDYSADRIQNFLESEKIEVTEEDNIKLKFPEYVDLKREIDEKQSVVINVIMPTEVGTTLPKLTVSCLLKQTVNDLLNTTFKKYKTMMSKGERRK